jgi:hypothetical protein
MIHAPPPSVGWVNVGTWKKVKWRTVVPHDKYSNKKAVESTDLLSRGHPFLDHLLYKGHNFSLRHI